jgi:Flp pilus assembly protein TadD
VTPPVWYDLLPLLAAAALFAWIARHRAGWGRGAFFALSYFLVALSPVLGLVKMSYMRAAWVADHFQYLADIGVIALACAAATVVWRKATPSRRRLVAGIGGAVIATFAVCTFARARDYQSEYAMWTDTVAKNPGAWQAHFRLGGELLARMEVPAAADHFTLGIQLKPDDPYAHNYLGTCLVAMGRVAEGIEQYRESLRLKPDQFFPHACLGDAYASQKRYTEAIAEYRIAQRWNRDQVRLLSHLGAAFMNSGRLDEAIDTFSQAQSLAPGDGEVTAALAQARMLRGQDPAAK